MNMTVSRSAVQLQGAEKVGAGPLALGSRWWNLDGVAVMGARENGGSPRPGNAAV